ncbi:MAG: hypothetical protein NTX81_01635 [Candidatus Bathyarchaeota archaeon]|nr:hypothetical protein [Candidatus Bathyarchaeota archaeon]
MRQKIIQRLTELYHAEPSLWKWEGIVDLHDYSMNGLWVCLCRLFPDVVIGITEGGGVVQLQFNEKAQKFFLQQVIIPNGNRMGKALYGEIQPDLRAAYYNYTEGSLTQNPGFALSSSQDDPSLNEVQTQLLNFLGE